MVLQFLLRLFEARLRLQGVRRRAFRCADGRVISYLEGGPPDAEKTLLLVHGLGSSNLNWLRVLGPLSRRHRVVAVDLPGFGQSPLPAELEPQTLRDHTAALLEYLRGPHFPRPVVLAGQSMGGWISVKVALAAPEHVEQLVLINSAGLYYEGIRELRALLTPTTREEVEALWGRLWYRVPAYYRLFWRESVAHMRSANVHGFMDRLAPEDFVNDDLRRLEVPVSLIWGRADRLFPPDTVDRILEAAPSTRVHWLAKTGHVAPVESPRAFAAALLAILRSDADTLPVPPARAHAEPAPAPTAPT
jgi:pimeloyl-ACP methyl ester carboxylesterase